MPSKRRARSHSSSNCSLEQRTFRQAIHHARIVGEVERDLPVRKLLSDEKT